MPLPIGKFGKPAKSAEQLMAQSKLTEKQRILARDQFLFEWQDFIAKVKAAGLETAADIRSGSLERIFSKLYNYLDLSLEDCYEYEERVASVVDSTINLSSQQGFSKGFLDSFIKIVDEEVDAALATNTEYNYPTMVVALKTAIKNPALYSIETVGSSSARVRLNKDLILGTEADLATSITAARETLNYGLVQKGEQASRSWYIQLYSIAREGRIPMYVDYDPKTKKKTLSNRQNLKKVDRVKKFYQRIMETRLAVIQEKPAFWLLLENGSESVKLSSDKGGFGSPTTTPTHFMEKAEARINALISEKLEAALGTKKPDMEGQDKLIAANREKMKLLESLALELDKIQRLHLQLFAVPIVKGVVPLHLRYASKEDAKRIAETEALTMTATRFQTLVSKLDQIVNQGILSKKDKFKFLEQTDDDVSLAMRTRLRLLVVQTITQPRNVPYRIYVGTQSNVELRLRTKAIKQDILEYVKLLGTDPAVFKDIQRIGRTFSSYLDVVREETKQQNLAKRRASKK